MNDREFVSAFVQQKERFIRQNLPQSINRRTLDLFENWIKQKLGTDIKTNKESSSKPKQDLSFLLDQAVTEANSILLNASSA